MPRNVVHPWNHVQDFHAAFDFITETRGLDGKIDLDQVFLMGTSFAGGHVLVVGTERQQTHKPLPAGIIAQVPHLSGKAASIRSMRSRGVVGVLRFLGAALSDYARTFSGLSPTYVNLSGQEGELAVMQLSATEYKQYWSKIPPSQEERLGFWDNRVAARIGLLVGRYSPIDRVGEVPEWSIPVMVSIAQRDSLCPPELVDALTSRLPDAQVVSGDWSHFDVYETEVKRYLTDLYTKFIQKHSKRTNRKASQPHDPLPI